MSTFTIGFLDSGVGGLSVLARLADSLAGSACNLRLLYLGDTARFPYGDRPSEEIRYFVAQLVSWLSLKGSDSIVIACHTAGSAASDVAVKCTTAPMYDLNRSAIELASGGNEKTIILATTSTVKSGVFSRAIRARNPHADVCEIACPDLAPLVESGFAGSERAARALQKYVDVIVQMEARRVVLACTHFSFLSAQLAAVLPDTVLLLDPAAHLAGHFRIPSRLCAGEKKPRPIGAVSCELFTTGNIEAFQENVTRYLGPAAGTVSGINLDELEAAYAPASGCRAALA